MRITADTHHGNFRHVQTVDGVETVEDLRQIIADGAYVYPYALNDMVCVAGLLDRIREEGQAWHGWTHYIAG